MDKNLRACLVELIGTFAVVFVTAGAVCVNGLAAIAWQPSGSTDRVIVQPQPGLLGVATAAGCIYAVGLAVSLPFSGGYLNPAVPFMLWVFKRLESGKAFAYIGVQLLGAAAAGGLLRMIFWFREDVLTAVRLGTPHLNLRTFDVSGVTPLVLLSGVGMELALTFILVIVIFATLIDPRGVRWLGPGVRRWACLWAGLLVAAGTIVAFPVTGAAMNPARWFGTAMWEMTIPSLDLMKPFRDHVVYWFGPIAGALLAGVVYTTWILPAEEETASGTVSTTAKTPTGAGATLFRSKK